MVTRCSTNSECSHLAGHYCDPGSNLCEKCSAYVCNPEINNRRDCCSSCPDDAKRNNYDCSVYEGNRGKKPGTKHTDDTTASKTTSRNKKDKHPFPTTTFQPTSDKKVHLPTDHSQLKGNDVKYYSGGVSALVITSYILVTLLLLVIILLVLILIHRRFRQKRNRDLPEKQKLTNEFSNQFEKPGNVKGPNMYYQGEKESEKFSQLEKGNIYTPLPVTGIDTKSLNEKLLLEKMNVEQNALDVHGMKDSLMKPIHMDPSLNNV